MNESNTKHPVVRLHTSAGIVDLELDSAKAPHTVENFLDYVRKGQYDNTLFHRVINGFMVQGGGFEAGMRQKQVGSPIQNEAANGLRNARYTIAMARTGDPHSATSQFFVNVADNDFLNHTAPTASGWGYCVFGRVSEGKDVVDRIKSVRTTRQGMHQDVPEVDVLIERAEVLP